MFVLFGKASSFKMQLITLTQTSTDIFYEDSHQENYKIFSKYINNVISNDKYTSLKVSTKNLIAKKDANKDNLIEVDKLKELISKAKNPEQTYSIGDSDAIVANTISNTVKGCWSIPLGLPATEKNLMVRIKLKLRSDGSVAKSEIIDHQRMNKPGQGFYKVLAESALRAVKLCSPFNVKVANNQEILLKFDARNILFGTPSIEDKKTEIAKAEKSSRKVFIKKIR